jgi:hypothetical protein
MTMMRSHRAQVLFPAFILLLLVPLAAAYAQEAGWKTYEDPLVGIKVDYPSDWVEDPFPSGVGFLLPGTEPSQSKSQSSSSTITSLTSSVAAFHIRMDSRLGIGSPERVLEDYMEINTRVFDGFRILKESSTTVDGLAAERVDYTYAGYDAGDDDDGVDVPTMKSTKIAAVNDEGNTAYIITFFEEASEYDRLMPTFEKMLQSVKIQ